MTIQTKRVLLVEPGFPISKKSKNHKNFLPIGLLKIASLLKKNGIEVKFTRCYANGSFLADSEVIDFDPDEVWVTSSFTYWAEYVKSSVEYYKQLLPNAKVIVGGIYASLMPEHCKHYTGCDEIHIGLLEEAETCHPDYSLVKEANHIPIDYQIIHASRGCARKCSFCGTWEIEPNFVPKKSILEEITAKKLIFYDNNFLHNPYVEDILGELCELKQKKQLFWCECQSGLDGRILLEKPYLGKMLKNAGFRYPRIAWDWEYKHHTSIKKQLDILLDSGYNKKDIYIFMIYNWKFNFSEMEKKRISCWDWKIQIADCRYRPLNQVFDNYNPRVSKQTADEYFIGEEYGWSDDLVRIFRKNIRRQNICIRQQMPFYSRVLENMAIPKSVIQEGKLLPNIDDQITFFNKLKGNCWIPDR
ncbi:cobalamin-dependent protein [Chloroflexota bacterium]